MFKQNWEVSTLAEFWPFCVFSLHMQPQLCNLPAKPDLASIDHKTPFFLSNSRVRCSANLVFCPCACFNEQHVYYNRLYTLVITFHKLRTSCMEVENFYCKIAYDKAAKYVKHHKFESIQTKLYGLGNVIKI